MSTDANKAIDRRIVDEVLTRGGLTVADELIAPDFVDHAASPGMERGPDGFRAAVAAFRTAFPDLHVTIEDHIADGDRVARRMTMRGTHHGELFGIPPTSKAITITGIHIVRLADGKVAEHWGVNDDIGLLQQLGVIPAPEQAEPDEPDERPRPCPHRDRPRSSEEPKAIVARFLAEVINRGKLDACDELIAADYVYRAPGMEVHGPEGIKGVFTMLRSAFPDWRETTEDLFAEGDRVVFRVTGHGTHQGAFFGIPPTGTAVRMAGFDIVRLEGGQMVEHWAVFDQLGLLRQLGVAPGQG